MECICALTSKAFSIKVFSKYISVMQDTSALLTSTPTSEKIILGNDKMNGRYHENINSGTHDNTPHNFATDVI